MLSACRPTVFSDMAVAHPDLGLVGEAREHRLVERDRFLIAADPAERRRLEILVRRHCPASPPSSASSSAIASAGPVLLVEHGGEVGARRRRSRARARARGAADSRRRRSGRAAPASSAIIRIAATSVGFSLRCGRSSRSATASWLSTRACAACISRGSRTEAAIASSTSRDLCGSARHRCAVSEESRRAAARVLPSRGRIAAALVPRPGQAPPEAPGSAPCRHGKERVKPRGHGPPDVPTPKTLAPGSS